MNKPKEYIKIKLLIAIVLLAFFSCENREWDNPFDPDCPKELFTPANFIAKQEGNVVKLTWSQSNTQISGFVIERSVDGSTWTSVTTPSKAELTWSDSNISGGKIHSYRIVAKAGNNRSNEISMSVTPVFPPTLTTNAITNQTSNSATCEGNITNDGGSTVVARGVCWSLSPNPTVANSKTTDGIGTGVFVSQITGLTPGTIYYLRSYATTQAGTSYGSEKHFIASSDKIIDADINIYNTVKIGTQFWMKENLKTTKFNSGETIPYWTKTGTRGYCWYNDDANNKNIYGAIYNFYTATDIKGVCPEGWHLPSVDEWTTLINYLGGELEAGGKLKESGVSHWISPNTNATNLSEFSALPGGGRDCGSSFVSLGQKCHLWSNKTPSGGWVTGIYLDYNSGKASIGSGFDCNASYIRCIKD